MANVNQKKPINFTFEEQGITDVTNQIMNAYNSGVIGHENGQYNGKKQMPGGTEVQAVELLE